MSTDGLHLHLFIGLQKTKYDSLICTVCIASRSYSLLLLVIYLQATASAADPFNLDTRWLAGWLADRHGMVH